MISRAITKELCTRRRRRRGDAQHIFTLLFPPPSLNVQQLLVQSDKNWVRACEAVWAGCRLVWTATLNPDSGLSSQRPLRPPVSTAQLSWDRLGANEELKQGDGAQKCKLARTLRRIKTFTHRCEARQFEALSQDILYYCL